MDCAEHNPHEAAGLLRYELVEDEQKIPFVDKEPDGRGGNGLLTNGYPGRKYPIKGCEIDQVEVVENDRVKEVNMDKPRICEVLCGALGVEPGEDFNFDGVKYVIRKSDGLPYFEADKEDWWLIDDIQWLANMVNHPDRIIRKPRWTKLEVEMAKAIKTLYPDAKVVAKAQSGSISVAGTPLALGAELFPSLQSGGKANLEEICGGAK